jgi:hypothetical protein
VRVELDVNEIGACAEGWADVFFVIIQATVETSVAPANAIKTILVELLISLLLYSWVIPGNSYIFKFYLGSGNTAPIKPLPRQTGPAARAIEPSTHKDRRRTGAHSRRRTVSKRAPKRYLEAVKKS